MIFFGKGFENCVFFIFKTELATMYQKWKFQKIDNVLRIQRPLPPLKKIERLFKMFPSISTHNRFRVIPISTFSSTSEATHSERDQTVLFFNIIRTSMSSHLNFAVASIEMKNDSTKTNSTDQVFEGNIFMSFTFRSSIRKNSVISKNITSMFFSIKPTFKNRNEISNQSLSVSSTPSSSTSSRSSISVSNGRIHSNYSDTLFTISINSFIAIDSMFKDPQPFLTVVSRFQEISFFQQISAADSFQNSQSIFAFSRVQVFHPQWKNSVFSIKAVSVPPQQILSATRPLLQMVFASVKIKPLPQSIGPQLPERIIDADE